MPALPFVDDTEILQLAAFANHVTHLPVERQGLL